MSDFERNELREILHQATEEARSMSREEAMQKLIEDGYYTIDGHLAPRYGGKPVKDA